MEGQTKETLKAKLLKKLEKARDDERKLKGQLDKKQAEFNSQN